LEKEEILRVGRLEESWKSGSDCLLSGVSSVGKDCSAKVKNLCPLEEIKVKGKIRKRKDGNLFESA